LKHCSPATTSVTFPIVLACVLLFIAGPLSGQTGSGDARSTQRFSASSIEIEPVDSGDVPLPPEFRVAIYENLIVQINKTGKFQHVYRSGDKEAAGVPDLVTLHTTAETFTKGSQRKREVTTVTGSTSMTLKLQITDHGGRTLVNQDVRGRVRFFGENLAATHDFSKKVATIVQNSF
jgi:hypothetical protein